MGYFKRPIRRSRAGRQAADLTSPAADITPSAWSELPVRFWPSEAWEFVRFEVRLPWRSRRDGLFVAAGMALEHAETAPAVRKRLSRAIAPFNQWLAAPPRREVPPEAIFWFRNRGSPFLDDLRALVGAVRRAGGRVYVAVERQPGQIVYRDRHQVAAKPFRDRLHPTRFASAVEPRDLGELAAASSPAPRAKATKAKPPGRKP